MLEAKSYGKRIKTAIKTIFKSNMCRSLVAMPFLLYVISPSPSMAENKSCTLNEQKLSTLKNSRSGDFTNVVMAQDPFYAGDLTFKNSDGKEVKVSDFKGKTVFLNLWATWCAPCRDEMPDIAKLQDEKADDSLAVVAVNIDKQEDSYVHDFLKEYKADNLPFYRDTSMEIFHKLRREGLALGLPTTLIIDKEGCLTARLIGSAPWGDENGMKFIDKVKELDAQ
ncbi:TlpA family protein disulfide reductase [Bartonella sp. HY329]|uniref:TlpA disulfide reductase family protein n=1 Tax=unclassified Bartonella TaxID=2645622 RepID=UPI0021CA907F|nr:MULTISPECIES: TlpA disulfide reductase family protein [unclassified Bartonella]UXM95188.1 TlpA family protein disulfide reductase [Bartonella sp. HY329]UXN09511.1 TlpA family protein disulfide reductase [Bartonella sp. HY328]